MSKRKFLANYKHTLIVFDNSDDWEEFKKTLNKFKIRHNDAPFSYRKGFMVIDKDRAYTKEYTTAASYIPYSAVKAKLQEEEE